MKNLLNVIASSLLLLFPTNPLHAQGKAPGSASEHGPAGKVYVYKESAAKPRQMEIYFPPDHDPAKSKVPGLILFHGGGWTGGSLSQFRTACHYFASRGLVCATAEYQMLSKSAPTKLPEGETRKRVCVTDAKSAIRWFKQHADELGIDAKRIITGGGSAGGHISALATLNPGLNDPADNTDFDTSVVAYLWFNPAFSPTDDQDSEIDVLRHLTADIAPAIAFFGTKDNWKIGWDAAHQKLKTLGNSTTELWLAPDQGHSFFNRDPWQTSTLIAADRFLVQQGLLTGEPTLSTPAAAAKLLPEATRPLNVVFILADDLGWGELGCYGQQKIPTPHLDRLASQGMRFTQHYSGAPVCAPARCTLMTGKHLGHAEVRGNLQAKKLLPQFNEGQYPLSESAITIAQVFQQAGYATGAMGKWGLGPVGSTGDPNRKGFDLFFGYNCQGVAHSFYPAYLWRNSEQITINTPPIPGHAKRPQGEVTMQEWIGENYAPTLMVAEAEKFIASNQSKPFFLYLPFTEPHVAMHPPIESVNRFPEEWDSEVYRGLNAYLPHPRPRAAYAAMISDLDDHVGRVLAALDAANVTDHTLVIFTSDNGTTHEGNADPRFHIGGADAKFFNSTAGLRGYKGSVYEGGLRVPMIARLPGKIAPGTVNDAPSYFPDWFPTLCDAAGFAKPAGLDGESLWETMTTDQKMNSRNPMIWVFPEYGGQVAVRLGDYKVIRRGLKTNKPGQWEVYHLAQDQAESNDIAATRPDLVEQTKELLQREVSENAIFPVPNILSTSAK